MFVVQSTAEKKDYKIIIIRRRRRKEIWMGKKKGRGWLPFLVNSRPPNEKEFCCLLINGQNTYSARGLISMCTTEIFHKLYGASPKHV